VARKYLNNPVRVEIGSVLKPAENVELRTFEVEPDKSRSCWNTCWRGTGSFLVFVRTKHGADRWRADLSAAGTRPLRFTRPLSKPAQPGLRSFSEGRHRVRWPPTLPLRGIDVANVAHVMQLRTCPRWPRTLFIA